MPSENQGNVLGILTWFHSPVEMYLRTPAGPMMILVQHCFLCHISVTP